MDVQNTTGVFERDGGRWPTLTRHTKPRGVQFRSVAEIAGVVIPEGMNLKETAQRPEKAVDRVEGSTHWTDQVSGT